MELERACCQGGAAGTALQHRSLMTSSARAVASAGRRGTAVLSTWQGGSRTGYPVPTVVAAPGPGQNRAAEDALHTGRILTAAALSLAFLPARRGRVALSLVAGPSRAQGKTVRRYSNDFFQLETGEGVAKELRGAVELVQELGRSQAKAKKSGARQSKEPAVDNPMLAEASRRLEESLQVCSDLYTPASMSCLIDGAFAFAQLRVMHEPLMKALHLAPLSAWKAASLQQICKAVSAFSLLEVKDANLIERWRECILLLDTHGLGVDKLADLCMACGNLQVNADGQLQEVLETTVHRSDLSKAKPAQLAKIALGVTLGSGYGARRELDSASDLDAGRRQRIDAATADQDMTKLLVPGKLAVAFLGKKGAGVKSLRENYAVKIKIEMSEIKIGHFPDSLVIMLRGLAKDRCDCVEGVLRMAFPNGRCDYLRLLVPSNKVGVMIGKQGANVERLKAQYGVNIKVWAREIQGDRQVLVSGLVPQVGAALSDVIMQLDADQQSQIAAAGGGVSSSSSSARPAWAEAVGQRLQELPPAQALAQGQWLRACARMGDVDAIRTFWATVQEDASYAVHRDAYAVLLQTLPHPQDVDVVLHMARNSRSKAAAVLVKNVAVMRLLDTDRISAARELLEEMSASKQWNVVTEKLCASLDDIIGESLSRPSGLDQPEKKPPHKYVRAATTALAKVQPNDPAGLMRALEEFSTNSAWLKFGAAFEKGEVLDQCLEPLRQLNSDDSSQEPLLLELGTFLGYSAMRMLLRLDGRAKIYSVERDPEVACIAMNLLEYAGLRQKVEVWIGQTQDMTPQWLGSNFQRGSINLVYMDHDQGIFHEDLQRLDSAGLLARGAKIIATQVLKPGAPLLIQRLAQWSDLDMYKFHLVSSPDCGLPLMEDWVLHATKRFGRRVGASKMSSRSDTSQAAGSPGTNWDLLVLAAECNLMRWRTTQNLVDEDRWNGFVQRVRRRIQQIMPSVWPRRHVWPDRAKLAQAQKLTCTTWDTVPRDIQLYDSSRRSGDITESILAATSPEEILELVAERSDLDAVGISIAMSRLRKVTDASCAHAFADTGEACKLAEAAAVAIEDGGIQAKGLAETLLSISQLDLLQHGRHWQKLAELSAASFVAQACDAPDISTKDLANAAWSIAKLQIASKEMHIRSIYASVSSGLEAGTVSLGFMDFQRLSGAMTISSLKDEQLLSLMMQSVLARDGEDMSADVVAHLAWSLARLGVEDEEIFGQITSSVAAQAGYMNNQEIARVSWALAYRSVHDTAALRSLAVEVTNSGRMFGSSEIAGIAWAFTAFPLAPEKSASVLSSLLQQALRAKHAMEPRHLATLAKAALQVDLQDEHSRRTAQQVIERALTSRLRQKYSWKDWSHLLTACNSFKVTVHDCKIDRMIQAKLHHDLGSQSLPVLGEAARFMALQGMDDADTVAALDGQASKLLAAMPEPPLDVLSQLAWALGTLSTCDSVALGLIGDRALEMEPQPWKLIIQVTWALARSGAASDKHQESLRSAVQGAIAEALSDPTSAELGRLAWSCSKLGWHEEALLLCSRLQVASLEPRDVHMLIWAFSRGKGDSEEFAAQAASYVCSRLGEFKVAELRGILTSWQALPVHVTDPEKVSEARVVDGIVHELRTRVKQRQISGPQELTKCLRLLVGTKAPQSEKLLATICRSLLESKAQWTPKALVEIMAVVADLRSEPTQLMQAVAATASEFLSTSQMEVEDASLLAFSFGKLAYDGDQFHVELLRQVSAAPDKLSLSTIARLMSFFAVQSPVNDQAMQLLSVQFSSAVARPLSEQAESQHMHALDVLQSLWPLHWAGRLSADCLTASIERLGEIGHKLDCQAGEAPQMPASKAALTTDGEALGVEVLLDLPDRAVLRTANSEVSGKELLQQSGLSVSSRGLASDPQWDYGVLDRAASGSTLVAKTYAAYFDLRVQQVTHKVIREHLILVHGWLPCSWQEVDIPIKDGGAAGGSKVAVDDSLTAGLPSVTYFKGLAHLQRDDQSYTLALARPATNRLHQLRIHAAAIGHPLVADRTYADVATFCEDRAYMPVRMQRGFQHEYRLAFMDHCGHLQELLVPLPASLIEALAVLEPKDAESAAALAEVKAIKSLREKATPEAKAKVKAKAKVMAKAKANAKAKAYPKELVGPFTA